MNRLEIGAELKRIGDSCTDEQAAIAALIFTMGTIIMAQEEEIVCMMLESYCANLATRLHQWLARQN